jgi:hypothetical protein
VPPPALLLSAKLLLAQLFPRDTHLAPLYVQRLRQSAAHAPAAVDRRRGCGAEGVEDGGQSPQAHPHASVCIYVCVCVCVLHTYIHTYINPHPHPHPHPCTRTHARHALVNGMSPYIIPISFAGEIAGACSRVTTLALDAFVQFFS